jgi:mannose-6-phosphate isomerase-like protein (cupin superfamily)
VRSMPGRPRAFVVLPHEGKTIRGPVGGEARIKVRTEDTGGTFTFIENVIPPKAGPPLHIHLREDEMWIISEGNFRFRADEEILSAPTGSFVFVPRGTRHCFQNLGEEPARILVMFAPSGMERFFEQLAELPPGPVDRATYDALANNSWMKVVGTSLADSDPLP